MAMSSSTMSMSMITTPTATSSMAGVNDMANMTMSGATASSTAMDDMSMMGGCKINMLWNWYTVDACFISSSWRITSSGMFAGSCIGVILLVMMLEALRRAAKEYNAFIVRSAKASIASPPSPSGSSAGVDPKNARAIPTELPVQPRIRSIKPTVFQQLVRALLHMLQFGVAYFIMLLAMYYNGYFIICILIGAFLGSFAFSWESIQVSREPEREITYCCG